MKKRIISVILSLVVCSTTIIQPFTVKASVGAGVIGGMLLEGGGAGLGASVIAAGPYVLAFAAVGVGVGVVYHNREEIQSSLVACYNWAKKKGKNLLDYFSTDSNGSVIINPEGLDIIRGYMKEYKIDSSTLDTIGHIGDFSYSAGTISSPSSTVIKFPIEGSDCIIFKIHANNNSLASNAPSVSISIGDKSEILYIGSNAFFRGEVDYYCAFSYDDSVSFYSGGTSYDTLKEKLSKDSPFSTQPICSDFSIDILQQWDSAGSICVDRLLGDDIGSYDNVNDDVTFLNPSLTADEALSVSMPTDLTWDSVIEVSYDDTKDFEISNTTEIPPSDNPSIPIDGFTDNGGKLTDKFPFCIPFDLARSVQSFNDTVNTKIEFDVPIPYCSFHFSLDFKDFEVLVSIFRFSSLVIFIISMLFATRNIIRG